MSKAFLACLADVLFTADLTWLEGPAVGEMFEAGGFATSRDGAVTVLAGATLGGGTKINWCASIRPPPHLLKEWAEQHGLPAFTSIDFDKAVEVVCERAGVATGSHYNGQNALLKQGLEALGKHAGEYPRNCSSKECSVYCTLGCKTGHKQSTDMTWLVDAVKAGGKVMTGVMVDKILMDKQEVREVGTGVKDGW
jgi:long-chain-alcohol oxidase